MYYWLCYYSCPISPPPFFPLWNWSKCTMQLEVSLAIWKFLLRHFAFTKDLLVPVFTNWKNPKRIFTFTKKGKMQKRHSALVFAASHYLGQLGAGRVALPSSVLGTTLSTKSQQLWAMSVSICTLSWSILCIW